ncbi:MAG TPA: GTP-binding protein [Chloroflexota bacterium]|nr:GTP-binding protein [Chloroflexota bacterium]
MSIAASDVAEHLNIVVVGHVDHGKSTLLGRLYADTGSLPDGKLEKVQAICRQQGKEFEYAFLFDAFLEEQEQGITIDVARTFFHWRNRQYIIVDAPGHREFLKNMVSGAARAEAALLLIDAHEGVREQSKKHGHLLSLLGVRQVAVVVNKMDLVGFRQSTFDEIEGDYRAFLSQIGVVPERFVPVSAKHGDNVVEPSANMPWYRGPTVLDALGLFRKETAPSEQPLRFPVQDVYKFDERRIIAGRVTAGRFQIGDRLLFTPSNKSARVKTIEAFHVDPPPREATAGESVGITLDEQIFVERGEIASHVESPPSTSTVLRCNVFWLGSRALERGRRYIMRMATREVGCSVTAIHRIIDAEDLDLQAARTQVAKNEVAEVTIRTKAPLAFDLYQDAAVTGRFVLVDGYDISGGGIVTEILSDEQMTLWEEARRRDLSWLPGDVSAEDRAASYGHRAAVVLVGGAPEAAGEIVRRVESALVREGRHAYLLQPDNLTRGLDADVADISDIEKVRRYGEVARVLVDAGQIVVSPANAFGSADDRAIETLVHPAPVLRIWVGGPSDGTVAPEADLTIPDFADAAAAANAIVGVLKERAVLAPLPRESGFRHGNYSI